MKIKGLLVTAGLMTATALTGVAMTQPTYALDCPAGSVNQTANSLAECNLADTDNTLMQTVNTIINVVIGVIGLVAVIAIILGGVTYVLSSGDAAKVKKAKDTILYGVIGLIVSLLAFAIVNFVLTSVFSPSAGGNQQQQQQGQQQQQQGQQQN